MGTYSFQYFIFKYYTKDTTVTEHLFEKHMKQIQQTNKQKQEATTTYPFGQSRNTHMHMSTHGSEKPCKKNEDLQACNKHDNFAVKKPNI